MRHSTVFSIRAGIVALVLATATPSQAQFVPAAATFSLLDSYLSPQNALLAELISQHLTEITHLTTIITNTANAVSVANDSFALARRAYGAYQMLRRYDVDQLMADALTGMRRGFPELGRLENEVRLAIANGEAARAGHDPFFSRLDYHDIRVGTALRAQFAHAYQAAIYPMVFPESMQFKPNPTPAELLVQARYRRTEDLARQALQNTAFSVIAGKVKSIVDDADEKDNVDLKAQALNAQVNFQALENSTQMRNLREQEIGEEEANRARETDFRQRTGGFVKRYGSLLMSATREDS